MRSLPVLLLGVLLTASAMASEVQVLSVAGQVRWESGPLEAPLRLPAASTLSLAAGARVQLLLTGSHRGDLAVAVLGPARLRLLSKDAEVEVLEGARLRGSGSGRLSQQRGLGCYRLTLHDATAVFDGSRLYLVRGSSQLDYRLSGEQEFKPLAIQLAAGEVASEFRQPMRGAPPAELLTALDYFVAPPWRAPLPKVTLAEVRQAERASNEQHRTEREAASCGCTESKGTVGVVNPGTVATTPLERQSTIVRVRVSGVPVAK